MHKIHFFKHNLDSMALHKFNLIMVGSVVVLEACSYLSSSIRDKVSKSFCIINLCDNILVYLLFSQIRGSKPQGQNQHNVHLLLPFKH